jgi:DNA invertase Pin-like site-specific DNA recombinase
MARIGYARVSTDEQSDALEPQVGRLMAAGCQRVITDVESGKVDDRDGLVELLALVKARRVGEIVVTRVDRLGRHAAHADTLLALCEAQGVMVRALDGGVIETATPQGFLMARLQTGLAEMESRMLSLRVRRSFAEYRRQGRHLRKRAPFGYAKAGHQLRPHPEHWPLLHGGGLWDAGLVPVDPCGLQPAELVREPGAAGACAPPAGSDQRQGLGSAVGGDPVRPASGADQRGGLAGPAGDAAPATEPLRGRRH